MAAVIVQRKYNLFTGSNPLVTTLDFPITAGNFIHIKYFGSIQLTDPTTCSSDNGNTVNSGPTERDGFSGSQSDFFIFNANAGTTTITCGGVASGPSVIITEYIGVKNSANPLLASGINKGSTTPLQTSITNSSKALIIMGLFNPTLDDYTSLVGPVTLSINTTTGAGEHILVAENLNASIGTNNIGANTGGSVKNILTVAAFELIPTTVNVLRVGGGGSGSLGGGGGGEVLETVTEGISPGSYAVTVGNGGTGAAPASGLRGTSGGNTIFNSVTANGGGAGGADAGSGNQDGLSGGNGGGGGNGLGVGGTGDQFNGGTTTFGAPFNPGSGGGGATQAGLSTPDAFTGGNGGTGLSSSLSGSAVAYGGGGGGGVYSAAGTAGTAGDSSAGNGGNSAVNGSNGATNRGGGGGGAGNGTTGGDGGSGVVIITYKTDGSDGISTSSTGGTVTTSGIYTIHTFTASGTFDAIASAIARSTTGVQSLKGIQSITF